MKKQSKKKARRIPREQVVERVCKALEMDIEELDAEPDERFINIGAGALRCSVSKTGIVQIESRRPRWEVEFEDALDRARVKYSEEYFATLNLPAMREKAREQLGPRGAQFVRVFRCRVNPHQKQVFDMDQTKHADEKTESDVNSVLSALWA